MFHIFVQSCSSYRVHQTLRGDMSISQSQTTQPVRFDNWFARHTNSGHKAAIRIARTYLWFEIFYDFYILANFIFDILFNILNNFITCIFCMRAYIYIYLISCFDYLVLRLKAIDQLKGEETESNHLHVDFFFDYEIFCCIFFYLFKYLW